MPRGGRRVASLAVAFLVVVTVLAYGRQLQHAGFYADDWLQVSQTTFAGHGATTRFNAGLLGARPLLAALLPLPTTLFGPDPAAQTALGLGLALLAVLLLVRALVVLRVPAVHATAVGLLALLLPASSATRLWPTGGLNNAAVVLALLGLLATLAALDARSGRRVALHATGALLYGASLATYEVAATVIPVFFLAYLRRAPLRTAVLRSACDTALVAALLILSAVRTSDVRGLDVPGPMARLPGLPAQLRDGASVLVDTLTAGPLPRAAVLVLPVAVAGAFLVRSRRGATWRSVRPWAEGVLAAGVFSVAALLPFTGYLSPGASGVDNRGNIVFGLAVAAATYCLLGATVAAVSAAAGPRAPRSLAPVLLTGAVVVLSALLWLDLQREIDRWGTAAARQQDVLAEIERLAGSPAPDSVLFVAGFRGGSSPGLPVFWLGWDLRGAVQLRYGDPSLAAYPVFEDVTVTCRADEVIADDGRQGEGMDPGEPARYGRALFLDLTAGTLQVPRDASACRAVVAELDRKPRY